MSGVRQQQPAFLWAGDAAGRGKVSDQCLWAACKAMTTGLVLIVIGASMATVGFYSDHLSTVEERRGNSTIRVKNEHRDRHLDSLTYLGPLVMGLGGFIIVATCVMTFEARDTSSSSAKLVSAWFKRSRISLARQLLRHACYERVQLWDLSAEPYLRVLSPELASSAAGITDLWLSDICQLSHETVSALFNAIATSKKINRLTVDVFREYDDGVALLCKTLKNNRSIQSLRIRIFSGNAANEILRALAVNTSISELNMELPNPAEETWAVFSDMLSRNNVITSISVEFTADDPQEFLEAYAQGLSSNRRILSAGFWVPGGTYIPPSLWVPVRRNRTVLNRAMDFVLERREDGHCAECFELFFGRSCLTTNLTEIAGMSDVEARVRIAAAENRRREKYLVLTGVVRRSVVCWPADVTQIDSLNCNCWRAVTRYLKITDICSR